MLLVIGMTLYVAALVAAVLLGLKYLFRAYGFIYEQKKYQNTVEMLSRPKFKIEIFAASILIPAILILLSYSEAFIENKTQQTEILTTLIFLITVAISYSYLAFDRSKNE